MKHIPKSIFNTGGEQFINIKSSSKVIKHQVKLKWYQRLLNKIKLWKQD